MSLPTRLFILCLLAVAAGLLRYWTSLRPRSWRGGGLLPESEANRLGKAGNGPIQWGGARLPDGAETTHFLVVGTTGSGKTLTLNKLMRDALRGLEPGCDRRALIYDPKTEVAQQLSSLDLDVPVVFLNPFDSRCAQWDMSADVTSPVSALQVASILIPEESASTNRYFTDTSRDLLAELMMCFVASGSSWTLRDVVLGMRSRERLQETLCKTDRGRELFEMHSGDPRAFHNVLSTARSKLAPYEPVAALWARSEKRVALRDWVRGEMVLVLGNDDSARQAMDSLNRLIFQRACELALRQPDSSTRRTWFFLDEVREAGTLDSLGRLMTKGRSRGCCVALGFQDIHGLKSAYGPEIALEIVGQCSQKALLRMDSEATAKWASATLGQYEHVDVLRSQSGYFDRVSQRTEQWRTADVVMPSEFMSIPPTTMKGGLTGYYVTPHIGAFRKTLPLPWILGDGHSDAGFPNLIERHESEQYLEGWAVEDGIRLGLAHAAVSSDGHHTTPSAPDNEVSLTPLASWGGDR